MVCDACSRPLPDDARFCPACGHEVVVGAAEERRVVTVLFADIVGYSALTEHLDPERVKRLVDGAFELLIADINDYGGRVDKLLGDGILALFGAPVAHEDDPDRAVRAALDMHRSLARFVDDHELDRPIQLRVGVNTGEVLVGRVGGTDDYTAMGDVVNVASRLQALAPPGGIYVGDSTASLVSDEILRETVDTFEVRGRQQTERVWMVTGRNRATPGGRLRSDTPFVGRRVERELLHSVLATVATGRGAVVSLSGEAGVGKTRLVNEVLGPIPSTDALILAGVCAPYGDTNGWSPITAPLFREMEIDTADPPDQMARIVGARGVELYGLEPGSPALSSFVEAMLRLGGRPSELDNMGPSQARETLFRFIVEALRRRSMDASVVLWIDDLQWAHTLLIDLLHRVTRSLVDRPVLVITAQRDDAELDWPPPDGHSMTIRMALDPLTRPEADALEKAVLGEVPGRRLADQLFDRSGGNPLFLTELTELAASNDDTDGLPSSLRSLIASRLDQLPASARYIIDNAAVLGSGNPVSALETFAAELGQPFSAADVELLVADGFLAIERGLWRFRSEVVREVAYQTLTKAVRAERHAGTAAVMADMSAAPIEQVAHHAATAAELVAEIGPVRRVPPTIDRQAVELLRDAARRSLEVGALGEAIRQVTRAIGIGSQDEALERQLLLLRAEAASERHEATSGVADAQAVLDAAQAAGDAHDEGVALRLLGMLAQLGGDLDGARHQLGRSVQIFRDLGDDAELAKSLGERGFAEVFGGSLDDADWLLGEAEGLAERLGDRRAGAWVSQHQAWVAFLSGDVALAESRLHSAVSHFDDLGDRAGRSWAQGLQAYLHFYDRRFDEAEALAGQVRTDALELGERWGPAMMDSLVASIRLWSGRFDEADELSRRALAEFRKLGDRFGIVQALAPRARALVALGRHDEAIRALEEAIALSDSFGDLAFPLAVAAGTAVHLGLGERAVGLARSAERGISAMGADASEIRLTLALGLCQANRAEEALTVLLDVDVSSPYGRAVRAVAESMLGDVQVAIDDADAVWSDPGSTYLDRVLAAVAAATAWIGQDDQAAAEDELNRARQAADVAGDAVARALVAEASSRLLGRPNEDIGVPLGDGWLCVVGELSARAGESAIRSGAGEAPTS